MSSETCEGCGADVTNEERVYFCLKCKTLLEQLRRDTIEECARAVRNAESSDTDDIERVIRALLDVNVGADRPNQTKQWRCHNVKPSAQHVGHPEGWTAEETAKRSGLYDLSRQETPDEAVRIAFLRGWARAADHHEAKAKSSTDRPSQDTRGAYEIEGARLAAEQRSASMTTDCDRYKAALEEIVSGVYATGKNPRDIAHRVLAGVVPIQLAVASVPSSGAAALIDDAKLDDNGKLADCVRSLATDGSSASAAANGYVDGRCVRCGGLGPGHTCLNPGGRERV